MSGREPDSSGSGHLEVLAGWRYLNLAADHDRGFEDRHLAALRRFVDHVLGEHPHRFFVCDGWALVGIGPPDAHAVEERLARAFSTQLSAVDEKVEDDDGSWN